MYLLILGLGIGYIAKFALFTFHNVSINSDVSKPKSKPKKIYIP